jgi:hypothetical protein
MYSGIKFHALLPGLDLPLVDAGSHPESALNRARLLAAVSFAIALATCTRRLDDLFTQASLSWQR